MKKRLSQHHIDGLIALLLFGVFAACVLSVLLTGASAYHRLTARDSASYDRRTYIQYIAARVRQSDSLHGVAVEEFGGVDALVLGSGEYITRVYFYDGYLMELYCAADSGLNPEDGERILAASGLELSMDGGLLTITAVDTQGESSTLLLSLRSGEGAQT